MKYNTCHPELVSGSNNKTEILKLVQNDKFTEEK
jgi:hypothetical protein